VEKGFKTREFKEEKGGLAEEMQCEYEWLH